MSGSAGPDRADDRRARSGAARFDLLAWALRLPGPGASSAFAAALGSVSARLLRRRRAVALAQISLAFPDWSPARREALWRASVRHQGRNLAELAQLAGSSDQRARLLAGVAVTGHEHVDRALALAGPGRGVVVVTAHLGNWEICLATMARLGYPMAVVHHGLGRPALSDWLSDVRTREGDVELVELGAARLGELLASVRGGRHLVAMMDQNARLEEGRFVSFFGAPACTRRGPLGIALRLGVPLLPAFGYRTECGTGHRIEFGAPIELHRTNGPGGIDAAIDDGLERINRAIEAAIRAHPEQWIWSHRRYRTRPPTEVAARFPVPPPEVPPRRRRHRR